ncbi:iron ABC transporter permease [Corynebacterium sp. 320]|uniref:FecCD family ABC transporter permease n=1 Tax=Corynebacterium TaxID=1716 RepID=UPI00125CC7A9|nr:MULTISPECIES: iron ABC transporter permease [Corynebacterium]KAB1504288.1 iron ABC transporter permease [Corynebacterium sp. 320]KAB1552612.1 iron ABC transporter permease [Corynebacterium sp. 321]KAB1554170.1 iron ABC transporter permease [Corynebacterium sp. 319]KAB3528424.1 iron ABC transporter permease [Corynebacterium sp. 250]KAB3540086.1 iron ABC transporter permease [Corynebacterium sp. 366]
MPHSRFLALVSLALLCALTAWFGLSIGPTGFDPAASITSLAHPQHPSHTLIVHVRLPRTLTALAVGAALALAGAAMQAVFRNPLAEPGITGVSSGAAVAAVLLITTGLASIHPAILPAGAFAGALTTVFLVHILGAHRSSHTILLVGIAINAFLGALIAATIANAVNSEDARSAMFWLNGDLTGSTMNALVLVAIPLALGAAIVLFFASELNLLSLGEAIAHSTGLHVQRTTHLVLLGAALTTAAGVAITGIISFVGLVVPHLIRLMFGSDHRFLLPASALLGAAGLTIADIAARMLWHPVALQTGTVTALLGAPFLLVLILRSARSEATP